MIKNYRKYFNINFREKANCSEFWSIWILNIIIVGIIGISVSIFLGRWEWFLLIVITCMLVLALPNVSMVIKRLNDVGCSNVTNSIIVLFYFILYSWDIFSLGMFMLFNGDIVRLPIVSFACFTIRFAIFMFLFIPAKSMK